MVLIGSVSLLQRSEWLVVVMVVVVRKWRHWLRIVFIWRERDAKLVCVHLKLMTKKERAMHSVDQVIDTGCLAILSDRRNLPTR